ncbi:MAG: FAD-dependent oxidoreductase [Verrucomicrobiales bacterium]|jgi:flavin-dependent dehydrogenase|nr:FAD-dependent oxidoreductase [Verrucomicrobiales bacterium]
MSARQHEVLVIGGGPAGAALAIHLARAGREVLLVEKEPAAHDKVCGEFLSTEAIGCLRELGLDPLHLGAVAIGQVRVIRKSTVAENRLPFSALSLTRRVLDEALLTRAQQNGVKILRGQRVQNLAQPEKLWQAQLANGETLRADSVFLATGKHDLRGWKRRGGLQNDLIAFKMHWRLSPRQQAELTRQVELILFPGGYCGLEPVETGIANLCLLIRQDTYQRIGSSWDKLLRHLTSSSPHLSRRLQQAEPLWTRPLAASSIPYGYVNRRAEQLWRLGDQAAVIPSFSGDGISIALHSARLAAGCHLAGKSPAQFQSLFNRSLSHRIKTAALLSHAMTSPLAQPWLALGARLFPVLLRQTAALTRIPSDALDFPPTSPRNPGSPQLS